VTGGSRGIGRAIATKLASEGAQVVVNFNSGQDQAEAVVTEIVDAGGSAFALQADVSDSGSVDAMVTEAITLMGAIDILVNNAGITDDTLLVRMTPERWSKVIETNLSGSFNCLQRCAKHMMKQRYGRIINLSSVVGLDGNAGQSNYAAAKAGIVGLTRSVAKELAPRGITANAVAPGFIETEMTKELSDDNRAAILRQIPAGRFGRTDEVAGLVAYLASEQAGYLTGTVVRIDGGILM